jgi:hypothetical protein
MREHRAKPDQFSRDDLPAHVARRASPRTTARMLSFALAVFAQAILFLAGCGGSAKTATHLHLGQFAGYNWAGHVKAVGASWIVPAVLGGWDEASTWIGAEAPGEPGPFIQIGTSEQRSASTDAKPEYFAFWSDRTYHFLPQELFIIHADDEITSKLTFAGSRWQLSVIDHTAGVSAVFTTGQESNSTGFDEAQWIQEDVTNRQTGGVQAYPRLARTALRDVTVNSHVPSYMKVRSKWMSAGAGIYAPSPLRGGAFTIHLTSISAPGARYLAIAGRFDNALDQLEDRLSETAKPHRAQVLAAFTFAEDAVKLHVRALRKARWPSVVRRAISDLAREAEAVNARLDAAKANPSTKGLGDIFRHTRFEHLGLVVRRTLNLPDAPG